MTDPGIAPFAEHMSPQGLRLALRAFLTDAVREQAGTLDDRLCETATIPTGLTGTGPSFAAQTANTELIDAILITPNGGPALPASIAITVGEYSLGANPSTGNAGTVFLHNLGLVVTQPNRAVTLLTAGGALTPALCPVSVFFFGRAAPASNAPGVLH
jgi:hypothetical protein